VIGHIKGLWNTSKGGALVTFGGSCSGSAGIGPFLLIENIPFENIPFSVHCSASIYYRTSEVLV
jgi:hypothetical protein